MTRFLGKELLDRYHWSDQVAVGGDKKGGIEIVVEGVLHQLDGNIHVRHRFVRDVMYMAAAPAGKRIELIPTIENREIGARLEGIRVRALALHLVRGRAHPRGRHRAQFAPRGSAGFCAGSGRWSGGATPSTFLKPALCRCASSLLVFPAATDWWSAGDSARACGPTPYWRTAMCADCVPAPSGKSAEFKARSLSGVASGGHQQLPFDNPLVEVEFK